jgi:NodT family efflux transporter outer membrane factor (OMF) lipoprotein
MSARRLLFLALVTSALAGCASGPAYERPTAPTSASFKEGNGWRPVSPGSPDINSAWWTMFNDPVLDGLEQQVAVSNQNLAASQAAYAQARALVRENVSDLFPTVDANGSADKTDTNGKTDTRYQASVGATWAPDVWGRVRRSVDAAHAQSQASRDDLAAATLSAQSELASDYIQLRALDEQSSLLDSTISGYAETLRVTLNRYNAGVAARGDVSASQSQLATAQAQATDLQRQRATLEHAIAVLIGKPPSELSIAAAPWTLVPPAVPIGVPSALLERRPDIAAAERRAAAASAQVGVARATFFPDITLSASSGGAAGAVADILSAPNRVWSLGATLAETVLDFGKRSASVAAAQGGYDQAVAQYRQSVLVAFQNVEDALAASRVLETEQQYRDDGAAAATEAERVALNQYQAGVIDHTALIVAQNTALTARVSALQVSSQRLTSAVSLIEALGGGWRDPGAVAAPKI